MEMKELVWAQERLDMWIELGAKIADLEEDIYHQLAKVEACIGDYLRHPDDHAAFILTLEEVREAELWMIARSQLNRLKKWATKESPIEEFHLSIPVLRMFIGLWTQEKGFAGVGIESYDMMLVFAEWFKDKYGVKIPAALIPHLYY